MATYAIGDVQGCYEELQALLEKIHFDPARDRLWFVGDLVNRGPQSAAVLRFVRGLGARAVTVLGNHDLHLIAIAEGLAPFKRQDAGEDILHAPDREELLDWLRHQPLAHHDAALGYAMIHAGVPPQWDLARTLACAHEVEAVLRSADYRALLTHMYGNEPKQWDPALQGWERLRFIVNCLTRLRYCDAQGRINLDEKGAPSGAARVGLMPWFNVPARASASDKIVFGHWSTLGYYTGDNVIALDTGCVWGGSLTAYRLEDGVCYRLPCRGVLVPGQE